MIEGKVKILIAAGGTGGHVFPGIAIAEAFAELDAGFEIVFAGTEGGAEATLVPQAGWPITFIGSRSTHGGGFVNRLRSYARAPLVLISAWKMLSRERPHLVIGTGGFATGPLMLAAAIRRIPTAIVEPNAIAGRANRWLSHVVKRIFAGFERTVASFPRRKTVVTGAPVRRAITMVERRRYDASCPLTVLCYGGSQGARPLNEAMMQAIPCLVDHGGRMRFIHQVGELGFVEEAALAYKKAGFEAEVFIFSENMASIYRDADIAVARSGAGTVAELAATRIPSVLVPLPHAVDDHQRANAEELAKVGGAIVLDQAQLTGDRLAKIFVDYLEHPDVLARMFDSLCRIPANDAADRIARGCLEMLTKAV